MIIFNGFICNVWRKRMVWIAEMKLVASYNSYSDLPNAAIRRSLFCCYTSNYHFAVYTQSSMARASYALFDFKLLISVTAIGSPSMNLSNAVTSLALLYWDPNKKTRLTHYGTCCKKRCFFPETSRNPSTSRTQKVLADNPSIIYSSFLSSSLTILTLFLTLMLPTKIVVPSGIAFDD